MIMRFNMETNKGISNAIIDLGKQFNKVLQKMDRKPRPNVENMSFNISKNSNVQRKGEPDDETIEHVAAFIGRYESDEDSSDEDITFDELAASYKDLLFRYEEVCCNTPFPNKRNGKINQSNIKKKTEYYATISFK